METIYIFCNSFHSEQQKSQQYTQYLRIEMESKFE